PTKSHAQTPAVNEPFLGVNLTSFDLPSYQIGIAYMQAHGIKHLRIGFGWATIQWNKNDKNFFNWQGNDQQLNATPSDISIIGLLGPQDLDWGNTVPCPWDQSRTDCTADKNGIPSTVG